MCWQITIFMSNPAITALLAWAFLREPLRLPTVGGILLSLVGVALVAKPSFIFGGAPWTSGHMLGALFASRSWCETMAWMLQWALHAEQLPGCGRPATCFASCSLRTQPAEPHRSGTRDQAGRHLWQSSLDLWSRARCAFHVTQPVQVVVASILGKVLHAEQLQLPGCESPGTCSVSFASCSLLTPPAEPGFIWRSTLDFWPHAGCVWL